VTWVQGRDPQLISVIVPALNAAECLAGQLEALSFQDYEGRWEVVVADNGSTDATVEVAQQWAERLPALWIADASHGRGVAFARNIGVEAAGGDLLAFCDADDRADSAWLSEMAAVAVHADIVGGGYSDANAPLVHGFLPFAPGASMMLWRYVFDDLGGFDTDYLGAEDVDFSWRAQLSGYRLGFASRARIERGSRTTLRASLRQVYAYGRWDAILLREYRDRGLCASFPSLTVKRLGWLAIRTPYLLMGERRRLLWLRTATQLLALSITNARREVLSRRE